jgi:hypothetical protein
MCVMSQVDAYAGPVVDLTAVHQVAPLNKADWGDLQFQEFSGELRNALSLSGFKVGATVEQEPDVMVLTEYGVGPPKTKTTTSSHTEYGWVNEPRSATVRPAFGDPEMGYEVQTHPNRVYKPVGVSTDTATQTTFVRHFTAVAYDYKAYKANHEMRQLWKVAVVSEGSSGDLRTILPAMIATARPYFGKSTGKQIAVRTPLKGPEVEAVRTGVPPVKKGR